MTPLEIILLAVALAMDCFTISITSGFILKNIQWRPMLSMALLFGFFQAAMPCLGWMGMARAEKYISSVDHWIAFLLLAFIGGKMIHDGLTHSDEPHFNPHSPATLLGLAVATSIDALAVGISFGCIGLSTFADILVPVLIIGAASFIFSIAGSLVGITFGRKFRFPVEPVGGLILIGIGLKILIEHLFL